MDATRTSSEIAREISIVQKKHKELCLRTVSVVHWSPESSSIWADSTARHLLVGDQQDRVIVMYRQISLRRVDEERCESVPQ